MQLALRKYAKYKTVVAPATKMVFIAGAVFGVYKTIVTVLKKVVGFASKLQKDESKK